MFDPECSNLSVWVCEDDSGVINRIDLDSTNGQMTGFVASLDAETRLPKSNCFPARSLSQITNNFENEKKSRLVKVIMVVPLSDKIPPYPLCYYGTDGKGTFEDVEKRYTICVEISPLQQHICL